MEKRRGSKGPLALLSLLALSAFVAGCSSSTETMPKATGVVLSASTPNAGMNTCARCHSLQTGKWLGSKHGNLNIAGNLASAGSPTLGLVQAGIGCAACHDPSGDSGNLTPGYTGNVARPVIGCEACHGPGSLHADNGGVGPISLRSGTFDTTLIGTVTVSGQFAMCTSCHELLNSDATGTNPAPVHSATPPTGSQNFITDTHFAAAGTYSDVTGRNSTAVTGYALDYGSPTVCTQCHDPHGTADIDRDWSQSLHADKNSGHAWALFNWTCDGTDLTTCATSTDLGTATLLPNNRWLCQRCHTATGFAAYVGALQAGDTALADRLLVGTDSRMTFTQGWRPEMLKCDGCHSNNRGDLRNPGAYKATYIYWPTNSQASGPAYDPVGNPPVMQIYATSSHQFPDLGASNLCVICHGGRNNGAAVHNLSSNPSVDFSNLLFGDAHRFTSAATMFRTIGYEFSGRSYENPSSYAHDKVGTPAVPNTGTGGPCVGCHMYRASGGSDHLLMAVSKATQTITNVSSEACFNCHENSSTGLAKIADDERVTYANAKSALTYFLGTPPEVRSGVTTTFTTTTTNWLTPGDTDVTGVTTGMNNLGAFFNSRYLQFERGAYIHNSKYVKRLIYDSLDWLDDNQMNYSVGTSLNAVDGTVYTWKTGAMTYVLPNGVRNGAPSERPY